MKKTPLLNRLFCGVAPVALALLALPAQATTYYWDNNGTNSGFGTAAGTWADPTTGDDTQGWSTSNTGVLAPAASVTTTTADPVNFGVATAGNGLDSGTITVSGTVSSGNITFGSQSGNITLSGGTLTLPNVGTITVNNSSNTIDCVLAGLTGSFTKNGTGTLALVQANLYTGTNTITGGNGVLLLNNSNALPSTSGLTFSSGILGLGAGDFTRSQGNTGSAAKPGMFHFQSNGGWAAYGADRKVNVGGAGGVLAIGSTGNSGTIGSLNGKTLMLSAADATHKITMVNPLDFGAAGRTIQVNDGLAPVDAELSGPVGQSAPAGLTKNGAGTLLMSATNTFTGATTINAGTLQIGGAGMLAGGDYAGAIANSGILQYSSSANQTFSGGISGTGALIKDTASSTLTLSGLNYYSGATALSNGTLTVTGQLSGTAAVTVSDGTTLNVSGQGYSTAVYSPGDLTLGNCTLGLNNLTDTNTAVISAGNVWVNGTVTLSIGAIAGPGQYPLIKYATALAGPGSFNLALQPGAFATLVTNTANQSIDLNVTLAPVSIVTDLPTTTTYRYAGAYSPYSLSVAAVGTPTLHYLWTRDGTPVGTDSPSLTLYSFTLADSGGYSVTVTNDTTSAQSSTNYLAVLTPTTYESRVLDANPLAFWLLNEASGPTATDYASYMNNGTYSRAGVTYGVPGPASRTVVTLDGTNGTVSVPYSSALNPGNAFSVELWVNPAQVPYTGSAATYIASSAQISSPRSGWYLAQDTASGATFGAGSAFVVRLFNQNGTTQSIQLSAPITRPQWYHLALTYDGNIAAFYANGALASSGTIGATGYVGNASGPLTLGMRSDGATRWPGSVGGVAVYGRALTSSEVVQHAMQPVLNYTWSAGALTLDFTNGVLQAAPDVTGPYTNVSGATSPYTVPLTDPRAFFRLAR